MTAVFAAIAMGSTPAWAAGIHEGGHNNVGNIGQPGVEKEINRTIEVSLQDNFFEPGEITVRSGETLRFILKNEGEFVHEFNIGTPLMHAAHQEEMMMMIEHGVLELDKINRDMMKMDMGDGKIMAHDDPNSKLLEPGETMEIIWKFSEEMSLEFACNIPGHYDSGMAGIFNFTTEVAQSN
ncbi:MAG: cupredoxin domain-containing protein [Rhodospirillaceae bacterium]|nr:cupredoxin domain-containing protein [Rhodospirillaceae bacterium]